METEKKQILFSLIIPTGMSPYWDSEELLPFCRSRRYFLFMKTENVIFPDHSLNFMDTRMSFVLLRSY